MAHPLTVQEAKRRLRLYNEKTEVLRNRNFRKQVFIEDHGVEINFRAGAPITATKRGADEEATEALALNLRFFVQERDGISLKQMAELYQQLPVPAEDVKRVLAAVKSVDAFLDSEIEQPRIVTDGVPLTNRRLFETFMYGLLAHANQDKNEQYERWRNAPAMLTILETLFEEIVAGLLNVIWSFHQTNLRAIQTLESESDTRLL
jgi:hypothetical protein